MRNKNRIPLILSVVALLIIFPIISSAQVPRTINYQSFLTGNDSNPVHGNVSIIFSIYNVEIDGITLWSQTQDVAVNQGIYSVELGGGLSPNPINLPFDVPYWLGVQVGSDIEMTPRQPLASVPYALKSDTSDYSLDSERVGGLDAAALQNRVVGVCGAGFSIRQINQDGSVVCEQSGITSESDPTVNALAKTSLICQTGDSVQWNGTAWVCGSLASCSSGDFIYCYSGLQGTLDQGVCKAGTRQCTAQGVFGNCVGEITTLSEVCDGLDNDCDGLVDNGLTPPLNDNQIGVCTDSLKTCDGVNGWINDYSGISTFEITEVTCNDSLDNDCDGQTDPPGVCLSSTVDNVQAVAGEGAITIMWDSVAGATSYKVYWSTTSGTGTNGSLITATGTSYTHERLIYGMDYYYVVTAVNGSNESLPSAEVTNTPNTKLISSIVFTDANLAQCVSDTATTYSAVYVHELTDMDCYNYGVLDIAGVGWLTSLQTLHLNSNNISDISVLVSLTNLQALFLHSNNISDISSLASLTNLHTLHLNNNNISDMSVLANLIGLQDLRLNNISISDISALAGLTSLQTLYLNNNDISNISILANLTGLQDLRLSNNNVNDISALASLTSPQTLYLNINNISDISAVTNLTSIQTLYLHSNNVSDISLLTNLTNLQDLRLNGNNITTGVADLVTLINATSINLTSNPDIPCTDLDTIESVLNTSSTVLLRDYPPNCI